MGSQLLSKCKVMSVLFEEITMEVYGDIRAKQAREDGIKQGIAKGREQERKKSEARIRELENLLQKKNSQM